MRENEFENFLNADSNIISKTKAINSRMSKARMIERHFETSLDTVVNNDDKMYAVLVRIKQEMKDTNGNISNALRKYYQFANGRVFPTLGSYKK